jgi:predicted HAD superfamily phosphohydrolase YqeG
MSSPNIQIHDIKQVITTLDNSILSVNEYYMLNDTIQELFDEYIKTNILSISNPYFIDEVIHNIK